jgi:predicted ATPase/DNA-binding winged helix-turn-helix (wHTH) protein
VEDHPAMADIPHLSSASSLSYRFDSFQFIPVRRLLIDNGERVHVGARALAVLEALIEKAGELVKKEELLAEVWPNTFVDDANLKVNVARLRHALRDGTQGRRFIVNEPGRGYRFVADVVRQDVSANEAHAAKHNLPTRRSSIVGRDEIISRLAEQSASQRLMTITGTGGIGKTTVAIAVAGRIANNFRDGVSYLDLAPLSDPSLLSVTVASLLGAPINADDPDSGLIAFLRNKEMLLVLDNCEHLVDAAAGLVDRLLGDLPTLKIIVTSQEALCIPAEWAHRLPPLPFPNLDDTTSKEALESYPATKLFVERASAASSDFEFGDEDSPYIADICRRLDGLPLALELAAAVAEDLGVRGIANNLADRFSVLTRGQKSALPRHRTLRATLDWSFERLPLGEKVVLSRLAAFSGSFSPAAAKEVVSCKLIDQDTVFERLLSLAAKSLIARDDRSGEVEYRLLESVRAYANKKLLERTDRDITAGRHAAYCLQVLEQAAIDEKTEIEGSKRIDLVRLLDDIRSALAWALGQGGEPKIGVDLSLAAYPLLVYLGHFFECQNTLEAALSVAEAAAKQDGVQIMALRSSLGFLFQISGRPASDILAQWTAALELADRSSDTFNKRRALFGLHQAWFIDARADLALKSAERFSEFAGRDLAHVGVADAMIAWSQHVLGDLHAADRSMEAIYAANKYEFPPPNRYNFNLGITTRICRARTDLFSGRLSRAVEGALQCDHDARQQGHAPTVFFSGIAGVGMIPLLAGKLELAESFILAFMDYVQWHPHFKDIDRFYRGSLLNRSGRVREGTELLQSSVERDIASIRVFVPNYVAFLGIYAEGLLNIGTYDGALSAVDRALAESVRGGISWYDAELLRVRAEILIAQKASDESILQAYMRALCVSREQGALFWELKAATSLARFLEQRRRTSEALELLGPIYGKFSESVEYPDIGAAASLLREFQH